MPFWKSKELSQMTQEEWELLCDGCGKCCLNKLIDEETDELYYTNATCKLLDREKCHCIHYGTRFTFVPQCTAVTISNIAELTWLPDSCAYRRLFYKRSLPSWHPLVSGSKEAMHNAGMSVAGKVVCESTVQDIEDHIVIWPLKDID